MSERGGGLPQIKSTDDMNDNRVESQRNCIMDVFGLHRQMLGDYAAYTRSFIRISDERISRHVDEGNRNEQAEQCDSIDVPVCSGSRESRTNECLRALAQTLASSSLNSSFADYYHWASNT